MTNYRLIKSFSVSRYTDAELVVASEDIVVQMTDNPHFSTPVPALAAVRKATDDFAAALVAAKSGSKEDTVIKNNLRIVLEKLLRQLAGYVEDIANNDLATLTSSGFTLRKKAEPVGTLPAPTGIEIEAGNAHGSLSISWEPIKGTYVYEVEYTEGPVTETSVWIRLTSSKSWILISNLKRGSLYVFRVAAAATHTTLLWSDEVSSYVM
jgi:hypothetical protein